jgi:hypothetical protein
VGKGFAYTRVFDASFASVSRGRSARLGRKSVGSPVVGPGRGARAVDAELAQRHDECEFTLSIRATATDPSAKAMAFRPGVTDLNPSRGRMRLWLGLMLISGVFTLFFLQQARENGVYFFPALLGLVFI